MDPPGSTDHLPSPPDSPETQMTRDDENESPETCPQGNQSLPITESNGAQENIERTPSLPSTQEPFIIINTPERRGPLHRLPRHPVTFTVKRSVSIRSNGTIKSHPSLRGCFGKLRITHPIGDSPPSSPNSAMDPDDDDEMEGPPPLDLTSSQIKKIPGSSSEAMERFSEASTMHPENERPSSSSSGSMRHDMGGGDVILILNLPDVYTVGWDSIAVTAKNFRGIKNVPPGTHFIWVSEPSGNFTRCGCWISSNETDKVHVLQWDQTTELLTEAMNTEHYYQLKDLPQTFSSLLHYWDPHPEQALFGPVDKKKKKRNPRSITLTMELQAWDLLTGAITEDMMTCLMGYSERGEHFCQTTDLVKGRRTRAQKSMLLENHHGKGLLMTRELNFSFSQLDRMYDTRLIGRERTQQATDSTSYIFTALKTEGETVELEKLTAELQFAFIVGMHLGNDACIQQWWWMLVKLILRAFTLTELHPDIVSGLLRSVAAQFHYSFNRLESPFPDYLSQGQMRELRLALVKFKLRLNEIFTGLEDGTSPELLEVGNVFARIEAEVAKELNWDLKASYVREGKVTLEDGEVLDLELDDLKSEDERGEYAPAVVNFDDQGRQSDLISWGK